MGNEGEWIGKVKITTMLKILSAAKHGWLCSGLLQASAGGHWSALCLLSPQYPVVIIWGYWVKNAIVYAYRMMLIIDRFSLDCF